MRKNILFITSCLLATTTFAENINTLPKDTTKVIDIEEVVVIASPKETGKLRELPTAVSLLSQKDMQANQITTFKEREFTGTQFLYARLWFKTHLSYLYPGNRFAYQHSCGRFVCGQYPLH